jgi:hypothetical protein
MDVQLRNAIAVAHQTVVENLDMIQSYYMSKVSDGSSQNRDIAAGLSYHLTVIDRFCVVSGDLKRC